MPVDLRSCPLSTWKGGSGQCRWCGTLLTGRQRAWCSAKCNTAFARSHHYGTARRRALRAAVAPCVCSGTSAPTHAVCASCGVCEAHTDGPLECNHVRPRLGNRDSYSCLHHGDNLEVLCHSCHAVVTLSQRELWLHTRAGRGAGRPVKASPRSTSRRRSRAA